MQEESEFLALYAAGASMATLRAVGQRMIAARDARYAAIPLPDEMAEPECPAPVATDPNALAAERTARTRRRVMADLAARGLPTDLGLASATARPPVVPAKLAVPPGMETERWDVACHEAGHAVAAIATGHRVISANCFGAFGSVVTGPFADALAAATVFQAGAVADSLFRFGSWERSKEDREKLATFTTDPATWDAGRRAATAILTANAAAVERVARRLAAAGSLTGAQLVAAAGPVNHFPNL